MLIFVDRFTGEVSEVAAAVGFAPAAWAGPVSESGTSNAPAATPIATARRRRRVVRSAGGDAGEFVRTFRLCVDK
jgi:hypothetical protein